MRFYIFICLLFFFLPLSAQLQGQPFIDSLIQRLPTEKNDTVKARLYKRIAEEYNNNNSIAAMQYAEAGLAHVNKMGWKKGIAVFYQLIGSFYNSSGDFNKSVSILRKAYAIQIEIKDSFNAASTLNNIGNAYLGKSVLDTAAQLFFDALQLAEALKNTYLAATCLNNIGIVYFNQANYGKALEYQNKALALHRADENKEGMAESYTAIGNTYQQKKDTINARKYYVDAIPLYTAANNQVGIATVYTNLSNLYTDLATNLAYKLKAQEIWNSQSPAHSISIVNMGNIALAYLDFSRYDSLRKPNLPASIPGTKAALLKKATEYLNYSIDLCLQTGDIANYSYQIGLRSEVEAEKGNFKNAYYDFQTFYKLNDSIYSQENKNKIAAIEGEREVAIRDKEIAFNKIALRDQQKLRWALLGGISLLLIIAILLYNQSRIRKRNNTTLLALNSQLDEANKIKAKFFGIISHDLRSPVANLINFLHLQKNEPGLLSAEQVSRQEQRISASAENLLETMEAMLLWSKGQMENFKPAIKKVAVDNLFAYIKNMFATDDTINFIISGSAGIMVSTDENYMQTIMHNLTANAVKALHGTTNGTIEWSAKEEAGKILLVISDNGPGVTDEQVKALYDESAFVNTKNGLGLHIIRDLARSIQCKVTMYPKAGGGTVFILTV